MGPQPVIVRLISNISDKQDNRMAVGVKHDNFISSLFPVVANKIIAWLLGSNKIISCPADVQSGWSGT